MGLFETVTDVRIDPEMLKLATQLVDRQSGQYDPADLEDRYETRLRAMIDAKVKGEGRIVDSTPAFADSNVIDLMAALRKSLGEPMRPAADEQPAAPKARVKRGAAQDARRQPGLKLPIAGGGRKAAAKADTAEAIPAQTAA